MKKRKVMFAIQCGSLEYIKILRQLNNLTAYEVVSRDEYRHRIEVIADRTLQSQLEKIPGVIGVAIDLRYVSNNKDHVSQITVTGKIKKLIYDPNEGICGAMISTPTDPEVVVCDLSLFLHSPGINWNKLEGKTVTYTQEFILYED